MVRSNRALTILLGIIATILLGWVLSAGEAILKPLVIAFLLASMLQPVVSGLARRRIPPAVTVILMVVVLFMGLVQGGLLLENNVSAFIRGQSSEAPSEAPPLAGSEEELAGLVTLTKEAGRRAVRTGGAHLFPYQLVGGLVRAEATRLATPLTPMLDPMAKTQAQAIADIGGWHEIVAGIDARLAKSGMNPRLRRYGMTALQGAQVSLDKLASDLAIGAFGFITNVVLVLIYMVFIFAEQAVFRRKILSIAGDRRDEAAKVLETIGRGIQRYLGVKTVVSLLTGALCYVVLVLLPVPYALLFGLLTFMLNYIPTFGSIIAGIFPTITALAGGSGSKALTVVVTYLSVNLILGSFIEPRILGRELNLSPLVVVVSVVVWAGLWGVVGGFLAVPLTATLQICLASQETTRPIAIMLGPGPPRGRRRSRHRGVEGPTSSEAA